MAIVVNPEDYIAKDLQGGYGEIYARFGGEFGFIMAKEFDMYLAKPSTAGKKEFTKEEVAPFIFANAKGILYPEKLLTDNGQEVRGSKYVMDIQQILEAGLEKFGNKPLILADMRGRMRPLQLYRLRSAEFFTIPGYIDDGSFSYEVVFWEVEELTKTGR